MNSSTRWVAFWPGNLWVKVKKTRGDFEQKTIASSMTSLLWFASFHTKFDLSSLKTNSTRIDLSQVQDLNRMHLQRQLAGPERSKVIGDLRAKLMQKYGDRSGCTAQGQILQFLGKVYSCCHKEQKRVDYQCKVFIHSSGDSELQAEAFSEENVGKLLNWAQVEYNSCCQVTYFSSVMTQVDKWNMWESTTRQKTCFGLARMLVTVYHVTLQNRIQTTNDLLGPDFEFLWHTPGEKSLGQLSQCDENIREILTWVLEEVRQLPDADYSIEYLPRHWRQFTKLKKLKFGMFMKALRSAISGLQVSTMGTAS